MSQASALTIVGLTLVLGVCIAVAIVRTLRRRSYQHWSWPARWAFLTMTGCLVALGAFALGGVLLDRLGIRPLY